MNIFKLFRKLKKTTSLEMLVSQHRRLKIKVLLHNNDDSYNKKLLKKEKAELERIRKEILSIINILHD